MKRLIYLIPRGCVLLLVAVLLAGSSALAQEGPDQLPPHVIDVWPYPGEEVPVDQPVEVTFDQPMDRASVEAAWQIEPGAGVVSTWRDDTVVSILPDGGWPRATRTIVTLGTGALAANGLPLEAAYTFKVQGIGTLEVAEVIPASEAEGVQADATITVSFNRPVVPLVSTEQLADLPQPLLFDPAVTGQGEWINTSLYVFTPAEPLQGSTLYTVSVQAGLIDVTGATLDETYSWQFKTLSPEIFSVYPSQGMSNVALDQSISVQFSQPMDKASTEEAFMLMYGGEKVPGSFIWSEDGCSLTFKTNDPLKIESLYMISIAPTARSASGQGQLETGINYSFYTVTYPGISATYPGNGERDVYPGSGVDISFKTPMNTETFADKVEIVSPEGVEWVPIVQGKQDLYMDFATLPETTYTITVKRGAEDVYGNAIDTDYTFTFSTRAIQPWASLPVSDRFVITNAYRENTRVAMSVNAKPEVAFMLYRVSTENIGLVMRDPWDEQPAVAQAMNLVRGWKQVLDAGPTQQGVDEVLLASPEGGKLPSGVYYLEVRPQGQDWTNHIGLAVVSANLTVKRGHDELLVWVTDIESAEPIANTIVSVYGINGALLTSGPTDADGLFRTPTDFVYPGDTFVYAVAESDSVYGVWNSWSEPDLTDSTSYIYTDRPIYRPGQTVYFRGAVRDQRDMDYRLPTAATVHVTINVNWGAQLLYEDDLPLSEFGTFNGELVLPEEVQLGEAQIQTYYAGVNTQGYGYFTIAEFRTPEYKVEVTPDFSSIIQGQPVKSMAAASYYFGGAVSGADLTWNAYGETAYFSYTGPGRYNFTDDTQDYFSWVHIGSGQTQTDSNGQVVINLESTKAPSIRPMTISIEAEVVDESGQYIAGRTSVLAHPADAYVGLRTDRYFGRQGQPLTLSLIAVTPDSTPLADQKIDLEVVEIRWERVPIEGQFGQYDWQQTEIEVESGSVRTGSDGTVQYTFTPPQAGIYRVRAITRDQYERVNSASLRFWVTGDRPVWWGRPSNTIDLIADKDSYQPGDTAEILIPTPFTGISYALVTVERNDIHAAQVFRVEGSTLVYELPITEEHVPTIHVSVALMKGTDEEVLNPSFRTGTISLNVEPVNQRVNVQITPSATLAQPGATVTFDVKTTDPKGEPVSTEVGITLTDQAILSLMSPNSGPLESTFYGYQSDNIYTGIALESLLDVMTDEILRKKDSEREQAANAPSAAPLPTATAAGEGLAYAADGMVAEESAAMPDTGGAAPQVQIREDFQQTPLWAPQVVTDQQGEASVSVTLPDNLTTWHLDARGITVDTKVGDAALDVVSTLPLLTRPVTPRFFVVGDRVTLASVINNNTNAAQQVDATLQAEGVTLESEPTQTITIEAGSRARIEWVVVAEDVPFVDLTFIAIGQDGYQDAVKPTLATGPDGTIPVYRYTAPDTVGTGGILREEGATTEAISLPPRLDADQGELTLHLDPSLAVTTVDALDYLRNYKHQCIEQTISRFLPNAMTYRALRDLGIDDAELKAKLQTVLDEALVRLVREQNPDGGWGWFGFMESNPYITAYAALGLVEVRDAGFAVDQSMIERALNFVRSDIQRPTIDTPSWRLNRYAFYVYVFARNGYAVQSDLDLLLDYRLEMDYWARAFLLMAYHQFNPEDPAIPQLVSDLQTAVIQSATGAHWEEAEMDWWNWSSETRTTAIVLNALTRVQPDSAILPNAVRWLMVAREGDHWVTTQETAWAVMALTDWMVSTGELKGNYDFAVTLNREELAEGTVTPDTVREGTVLSVQVKDLLLDEANRLSIIRGEGEGVLYYTAHLKLRLLASEAKPVSRGVSVSREYFLADDPQTPITQAQVGDVITVRVTMTLPQDIYYFVLEDPIPAGTEPIDTSLLTTSQLNQAPSIQPDYDPHWWWGWWLFDHTAMRDEEVDLYADFLPRGTYVYSYQVRASVPGEFQTMPSHAYAFYFPEVFGRGAGMLFTITPEAE